MMSPLWNHRAWVVSAVLLSTACFGKGRGRKGTVPVQPDLPPLPEYVEMCVSKVVSLPGKMNGHSWDGVGRISRKTRKLLPELAAAAQGGGYSAATAAAAAAGTAGVAIFNKVKGPPDLRVRVQLGREFIIESETVKDTPIAAFTSSETNCAVIEAKEYGERVQFIVEDDDVGRSDLVGTHSLIGIPHDSIRSGTWAIHGFDQVIEIAVTLQPMEKPRERKDPLPPESAPPTLPTPSPEPAEEPNPADEVEDPWSTSPS